MRCGEALTDNHDALAVAAIAVVEVAAGDHPDAERRKESRRHRPELRPRILFAVGLAVAFGGELRGEESGIAPRDHGAERHLLDPRQLRDSANRLLVEGAHDFGLRVYETTGTLTASTLPRKPLCCRCSANSVVTSIPAPASSRKDAAIWVTAKSRSRRFVPEVIRTLPLESPRPLAASADGRRGRKASTPPR